VKEAEDKAILMVEEGAKRRREMERVIADLETRRDAVVGGLEKLSNQLAGAATVGKAADPADTKPPIDTRPPAIDPMPPATNSGQATNDDGRAATDGRSAPTEAQPASPSSQPPPPSPTRQ
jgi:hypothetical protein